MVTTSHYPSPAAIDLQALVAAVSQAQGDDGLGQTMPLPQWELLSSYLQPMELPAGQILFSQGSNDRTLYLIESGSLSVHYQDAKQRIRLAMVSAGSVVGEGAFFSHRPRSATVHAGAPCRLWGLTPLRFTELSNRQPTVALALVMAVSAVLARRLAHRRLRVAST